MKKRNLSVSAAFISDRKVRWGRTWSFSLPLLSLHRRLIITEMFPLFLFEEEKERLIRYSSTIMMNIWQWKWRNSITFFLCSFSFSRMSNKALMFIVLKRITSQQCLSRSEEAEQKEIRIDQFFSLILFLRRRLFLCFLRSKPKSWRAAHNKRIHSSSLLNNNDH